MKRHENRATPRKRALQGRVRAAELTAGFNPRSFFFISVAPRSTGAFSAFRLSFLFRPCHKAITHASHSKQMPRIGRIIFDIAPQPHHEIIDGTRVGIFV